MSDTKPTQATRRDLIKVITHMRLQPHGQFHISGLAAMQHVTEASLRRKLQQNINRKDGGDVTETNGWYSYRRVR